MIRADKLLLQQQLVSNRRLAREVIDAGLLQWRATLDDAWLPVQKAAQLLPDDALLDLADHQLDQYVSRAAYKLLAALEWLQQQQPDFTVVGSRVLDIGASTGGFTDLLLQQGAAEAVCVDVGRDQLVAKLRDDPRVCNLESINARDLSAQSLPALQGGFDLIVMDVSFISQTLIIPGLNKLLRPQGYLISLVKPQFELSPELIGKGGIVRDSELHQQAVSRVQQGLLAEGWQQLGCIPSPIRGGDGNTEFLSIAQWA